MLAPPAVSVVAVWLRLVPARPFASAERTETDTGRAALLVTRMWKMPAGMMESLSLRGTMGLNISISASTMEPANR